MAKIYSQLEKAQLENTTSDTASLPKGTATYRTDLNIAKVSNGTVMKAVIDEDSTQTLANKTLTSPNVTGAVQQNQIATPTTPAAGFHKTYYKSDGKLYTLDAAGNEAQVGSGAGGGVENFITNGTANDTAATIFIPYADAAGTRPVDGTGGSPTVTTSLTSTLPLNGTKSFLLTKPASNTQGQGWAVTFSVDLAYRAKSNRISIDFIVNSGTFVAGTPTTDSDVIWYLYDITNAALIEPSNIKMLSNSTTISDKFQATFQTSSTGSSYRLIGHCATTSALAYELKVDNITVSPQVYVYGTPVTDWQNYSCAITATTTNPTKGAIILDIARYRRVGDSIEIQYNFYQNTAGTAGSGAYRFSLPPGMSIDSNKTYTSPDQNTSYVGTCEVFQNSTGKSSVGTVFAATSTTLGLSILNDTTPLATIGSGLANLTETTLTYNFSAKVAILGFSSSVQVSDGYDSRNIVFEKLNPNTGTLYPTGVSDITWAAATNLTDTVASWNGAFYTILTAGYYELKVNYILNSLTYTAGAQHNIFFADSSNNVVADLADFTMGSGTARVRGGFSTGSRFYPAGQTIKPRFFQSIIANASFQQLVFSIQKMSGSSTISASETLATQANLTSGQSLPHNATTTLNWNNVINTTHGSLVGTTFTALTAGLFEITAQLGVTGLATGTQYTLQLATSSNGDIRTTELPGTTPTAFSSQPTVFIVPQLYRMTSGQTLTVSLYHFNNASAALTVRSGFSYLNIKKIGL